jgi:hypothetical protein
VTRAIDLDALAVRRTREVRAYLQHHGWEPDHGDLAARRWTRPIDGDRFEVLLPIEGTRDYPYRMADVLDTLTIAEERAPELILQDLAATVFDVQRLRTGVGRATDTATLADAVHAFQGAQKLLSEAAIVIDEGRVSSGRKRGSAVRDFMRRVRAGQTSPGSYVVNVLVPVDLSALDDTGAAEGPFARQVTTGLAQAVRAAHDAATFAVEQQGDLRGFRLAATEGVTAHICKALANLAGDDPAPFEITFSWSADRPAPPVTPVRFSTDLVEPLNLGAHELGRPDISPDVVLRGRIERLEREHGQEKGRIVVRGEFVSDPMRKQRQATIMLSSDDYEQALRVHGEGRPVEVHGMLVTRRGVWTIEASSFTVVDRL